MLKTFSNLPAISQFHLPCTACTDSKPSAASSVNFCTKFRCTAIKNSVVDISSAIKNASVYTSYTSSESSGIKNKPIYIYFNLLHRVYQFRECKNKKQISSLIRALVLLLSLGASRSPTAH